ncbi:MAG: hypothetical protein AB7N99_04035 [Simkaniaceae bacterium]
MATRFDHFFEYLTAPEFVSSDPERFEYKRGLILKDSGRNSLTVEDWGRLKDPEKYRMVQVSYITTEGEKRVESHADSRFTLVDKITDKVYIAHNPVNLGPKFFLSAIIIPITLVASLAVQVARLAATLFINVAYQTFKDVYDEIDNRDIVSVFLRSFEKHVEKNKNAFFLTIERIFDACKYAAGMELAACYGAFYYNDVATSCKMQTIYAEIEKKWNGGVHYKQTPVAYGQRFSELYSRGLSIEECTKQLGTEAIKPTFYILECCQERNKERLELFGEGYATYEELQRAAVQVPDRQV